MFIIDYVKETYKGFKKVRQSAKNGEDSRLHKDMKNKDKKEWSLYGDREVAKSAKKHHWVHYVFKYKIIMPAFLALEKGMKKYFYEPTNEWYDEVYKTIADAHDEAMYDWAKYYIGINKNWSEKDIQRYVKNAPYNRLWRCGHYGIVGNDSAYRELENIKAFKLTNLMNERFANRKEWNHLFYTSPTIYDVNYYYTGADLLNRQFLKSETKPEEKILITKDAPAGHTKAYFTVDIKNGWSSILKEMYNNIKKIPKRYIITHVHLNAMGINNMELILFDQEQKDTVVERKDTRGRDLK